jgi:hypothetical protein
VYITAIAYKRLLQVGKIAGAITFLAGPPYAIFEYQRALSKDRETQTLSYFDRYNKDPIMAARVKLINLLIKHSAELLKVQKDGHSFNDVLLAAINGENVEGDIQVLLSFFEQLRGCVEYHLCSRSMTKQLFAEEARELFETAYPVIEFRRPYYANVDRGVTYIRDLQ